MIKERQEFFADQLKAQEARASKTPAITDFFPHGPQAKPAPIPTPEVTKPEETPVTSRFFIAYFMNSKICTTTPNNNYLKYNTREGFSTVSTLDGSQP